MVNKRILIISSSADISGAPLHALEILGALYKKYKFFVAVPLNQKLSKKFLYYSDNRVIHLEKKIRTIFFLRKLKSFVHSNNIEVVHSIGKSAGLYGRALKWLCPSVVHIFSSQGVHYDRYGYLKKIMFNIYEILSHAYVDKFIFASSSEVEKARRYMPWDQRKE